MPKCKLCGFRLADEAAKCSICGAMPRSTKARELLNAAHLPKYLCPSCKAEIIGEHRYCPACMKELSEAAKTVGIKELGGNNCIKCGVYLPAGAKFCHECGAKHENNCPHCGAMRLIGGFFYGEKLTNVTLPNAVTKIGVEAFSYCQCLRNVTIPNSVIEIGRCAFFSCKSLKSITVPKSVKIIEKDAFAGCNSLKNVSFENPNMTKSDIKRVFGDSPSFTEVKIGDKVVKLSELRLR